MMFQKMFQYYLELIEEYLATVAWSGNLGESMRYSLIGGGKRIRPVLALASAEAVGGDAKSILSAACALEMIHTYSLIHDDLPAMDNDDYRRGRLSNHKAYGEGAAILAGDALLTHAFELIAKPLPGIPAERQLRVIHEVAHGAGPDGMVKGQSLDLEAEGNQLTLREIENIHVLKTGAMLVASARLGGILAGGIEETIASLTGYAEAIGLAFQIKDDILDIEGDIETLGKPVNSDLRQNKSTYPSLLGLEKAKSELSKKISQAHAALEVFGDRGLFLHELADYIEKRER